MVKFVLILVLLAIGYNDIKSVLAKVPNNAQIFNDELMSVEDQLLPTKLEDYQNDENVHPGEGSGDPFFEGNLPPPQIEDTDKTAPDVAQDTVAKEPDQSDVEEIVNEDEEEVQISQVVEEEEEVIENQSVVADESDNINTNYDSSKVEESNDTSAVEPAIEQYNISNAAVSEEEVDTSKVQASFEQDTSKVDVSNEQVEDTDLNESQNNTYEDHGESESADKANIEEKSDNIPSGGELEPQETVQENEMKADQDKDEHASHSMMNRKFPFEKDLPAERFGGNTRGLGKSMPMQEAKPSDETDVNTVVVKPVEVEQTHNHRNEKEPPQLPEAVDKNREFANDNLKEQKEIDDAGASSASSGSNTVTFVIILGIVGLVGIVGYFVHKRRNRQRATPVPTHEDRELKEVKTHRPNDNDGGHKQASHIPEANPLILNNSHFKQTAAEAIPKNGHLPSAEQQQRLLTTLLVNNANTKSKDDDIRMMDDDVEDEKAERRPLVLSSFKPTIKTGEVTTSAEQKDEKQLSEDDDRVKDGEKLLHPLEGIKN